MNKIKRTNEEETSKKRKIVAFFTLIAALVLLITAVSAYFSDYADISGDLNSSTLKISAEYHIFLNDVEVTINDLNNLNPGDVIVVTGVVENQGNQSAWIREKIAFSTDSTLWQYLTIYDTAVTRTEIISGEADGLLLGVSGEGVFITENRVIDGSGENAQIESGEDFNYIEDSSYSFSITIYFSHLATNEAQGKSLNLTVLTQALQFKNNNTAEPSEAAWATVAKAS